MSRTRWPDGPVGRIRWRLISVPIYVKVFGIGLLISLLFASIAFYVMRSSVLEAHYQARGEMALSLAFALASRLESEEVTAEPPPEPQDGALVRENRIVKSVIDRDLGETMEAFPSVRYILVQDAKGNILSHGLTFPTVAPADLTNRARDLCASCHRSLTPEVLPAESVDVPGQVRLSEGSLRAYRRQEGLILEATAPIGDGQLGTVRLGVADKRVAADLALINHSILAGIALCLAATLCSAMLLTYVLNKPIRGLLRATKVIAEGDLTARAPAYSDDELGRLAVAFNHMAESLAESRQRILRADRLASIGQFAAGVAHEINNPLDGVLSCLERLRRDPANLAQNMEYLDMIRHALERVTGVIHRLLEYSQQREINPQPEDVRAIMENVAALVRVTASEHGAQVVLDFAPDVPKANCDRHYIEQTLLNLALNGLTAIEQTPSHQGRITMRASAAMSADGKPLVRIDVVDTGQGIDPAHLGKIFDAFFTTKESGKGTGLGLAIVKEIIEAHSGVIEVDSVVGEGTAFHVFLPASESATGEVSDSEALAK